MHGILVLFFLQQRAGRPGIQVLGANVLHLVPGLLDLLLNKILTRCLERASREQRRPLE